MDFFEPKKDSGEPQELDLTPMIAIFSMLVLFLIGSTVITEQNIPIPTHLNLPKGLKKEEMSVTPQIIVLNDEVRITSFNQSMSLKLFSPKFRGHSQRKRLRQQIKRLAVETQKSSKPFQILADKSLPYYYIYNLVNELRYDGIKAFLFVHEVKN